MKNIIIVSLGIILFLLSFSYLLTHNKNFPSRLGESIKDQKSKYECGLEIFDENLSSSFKSKEYIKYYIIALIFLLFDLESILLFPFTISIQSLIFSFDFLSSFSYSILYLFLSFIFGGLLYEVSKKVL